MAYIDSILSQAVTSATNVDYKFRLGAIVHNKGKVYGRGHNKTMTHTNRVHASYRKHQHVIHAEVAALLDAGKNAKGNDLTVVRIGKHGNLLVSKPCSYCAAYIKYVGIRNVTYVDEDGNLVTVRAEEL